MRYSPKYDFYFADKRDYHKKVGKFRKPRIQNTEKDREYHKKWRANNKDKVKANQARWLAKNPDYYEKLFEGWTADEKRRYHKAHEIKSKYGFAIEQFDQYLIDQNFQCAACADEIDGHFHTHIDHDHSYPKGDPDSFNGLLCSNCNKARGFLKNDILKMIGMVDYQDRLDKKKRNLKK